jgi:hypothetical protein
MAFRRIFIMARPTSAFRQQDVTRAARAVVAAGQRITGVQIDKDGKITVLTGTPNPDVPDKIALSESIHV